MYGPVRKPWAIWWERAVTYLANLWRILSAFGPVFSSLLEARAVERKEYFISRIVKIFIGKSDMAGLKNIRSVAKTRNLQDKISGALYYENRHFLQALEGLDSVVDNLLER